MRRKPCQSGICWHAGTRAWRHVPVWDSQPVLSEGSVTVAVFCWELGHSTPWHQPPLPPVRQRGKCHILVLTLPFPPTRELLHGWRSGRILLSKRFLSSEVGIFYNRVLQVELPCHTCSPNKRYWWWSLLIAHLGAAGWE